MVGTSNYEASFNIVFRSEHQINPNLKNVLVLVLALLFLFRGPSVLWHCLVLDLHAA